MISQKIKTLLYPIIGLDLEPPTPSGGLHIRGDVQPTLALLVGKGTNGTVFVEATDDGAVKTASTGAGLTAVEVSSGTAADAATDLALSDAFTRLTIIVEDFGLDLAFEFTGGTYSSDLVLPVGERTFEISAVDVRLNNTVSGQPSTYQVWAWS
jgi:hypothetical protein|tara:strand:- start:951 stop:1412 length:462 start_codon:yes stop_codon:yes gene_type:complete